MAYRTILVAALLAAACFLAPAHHVVLAADGDAASVDLQTQTSGNAAWAYLDETRTSLLGTQERRHISSHRWVGGIVGCGRWSDWRLTSTNAQTGFRRYGIFIYDGCTTDNAQVFPPGPNSCNPDDSTHAVGHFSRCVTLPPRTLVAGLTPQTCNAQAVIATSLNADVSPTTYDSTLPTPLTVTTTFGPSFAERLSEGFCTEVLDWQVLAWTIRWPDGTEESLPGTGQAGVTSTHTLAPTPNTGAAVQQVVAIAHLHIHGQALDFDNAAQLIPVTRDAFVDVSNNAAAVGAGAPPVYTPPQLQVGAVPVSQLGDGTVPAFNPAAAAFAHAVAIRGRLLVLYPRAIVLRPGTESVAGLVVGQGVTTTMSWRYVGTLTDVPPRDATPPNATGGIGESVLVQYNHVERLDARGNGIDELVPLQITAHTVYPDGHSDDLTLAASIRVSIYYPALSSSA